MASTWTDLDFELQGAGENLSTWGVPKLNNDITRINYAIAGYVSIPITGDYTLTAIRPTVSMVTTNFTARIAMLKFTGTLTANATITVPSTAMRWVIYNATNKSLVITTGAGTTVTVDTGDRIPVDCDGANCLTLSYGSYTLKDYIAQAVLSATGSLPAVAGNAGKFVYTDGATSYWKAAATTDLSDYQTAILGVQVALAVSL